MSKKNASSRRKFLQQLGGSALMVSAGSISSLAARGSTIEKIIPYEKKFSSLDKVRVGVVGMGIMGFQDLNSALKVPGVELGGVCDLYTGRLTRAKEIYGKDLFTTRDYRELLERKDIDAIIIATSDNWHARVSVDAMNKGKAVYCEKPMVHNISEGHEVVATQQRTKKTLQVGSQVASSIAWHKARELYKAGEIGQLTNIEANTDRQNALGAWEYTQPTDG
jgi:predicted dehydrogenase